MKLLELDVENFRGIVSASITLGPCLTVLHGPNEIGKSTLAEAIRAALLVTTGSQEGNSYISWGCSTPARVTLAMEIGDKRWRVTKSFGKGHGANLECSDSLESSRFRSVLKGNGVDGRLRELLCWGIAPPGGKGAPPKPTSYLVTALLGRQGNVQAILDASLAEDKDDAGRTLVTNALGVLGGDPLVAQIVERLTERVDAVFTTGGKFKTAADSPLVRLQEHLKAEQERLRKMQEDDSNGKVIQRRVVSLQARRQQLLDEKQVAAEALEAATGQVERAAKRTKLEREIDDLRKQLDQVIRLADGLASLQTRLEAEGAERSRLKSEEDTAASRLEVATQLLQTASEDVARGGEATSQSMRLAEAAQQQRRAELETGKASLGARLKDIVSAEQTVSAQAALERDLDHARSTAAAAAAEVFEAQRLFDHAEISARLDELVERENAANRLAERHGDTERREQEALERLRAAEVAVAEAESRRTRDELVINSPDVKQSESELTLLRAIEVRIRIQSLRDEVRTCEAEDARARECRERAATKRSDASRLEQTVASRVLPTSKQIASWRTLEAEVRAAPRPEASLRLSSFVPTASGLGAGLAVALAARIALEWSVVVAAIAGVVIAILTAGLVLVFARSRGRSQTEADERRRRLDERWKVEVLPSLQASGLARLPEYEGALAEIERLRTDAQRLRVEADQDDIEAAVAARAAALLDSRRADLARIEREEPLLDNSVVTARLSEFAADVSAVRRRIDDAQQGLETLRARLRQAADDAVRKAEEGRSQEQVAHEDSVRGLASARAELDIARRQCDPAGMDRLRLQIESLKPLDTSAVSAEISAAQLAQAREEDTAARSRVGVLEGQAEAMRRNVDQLLSNFDAGLFTVRRQVEDDLAAIEVLLAELESIPASVASSTSELFEEVKRKRAELQLKVEDARQALTAAKEARSAADEAVASLENEAASVQGQLKAVDRVALDERLQAASHDPIFQVSETDGPDAATARVTLERVQQLLEVCTNDLSAAKGQLVLITGNVGSERLARQEEAVRYAEAEVLERELTEQAALRLLKEIQAVEAERTSHLGRALGEPITERFRELTGGRYGPIMLDPDLRAQHVEAQGSPREMAVLSVGTREQLATLVRLAVAAHLQTAVVLDDQLVHTDSERFAWFSQQLRSSAVNHSHQIIVFTCRPADYLPLGATGDDEASVAVVDLATRVTR